MVQPFGLRSHAPFVLALLLHCHGGMEVADTHRYVQELSAQWFQFKLCKGKAQAEQRVPTWPKNAYGLIVLLKTNTAQLLPTSKVQFQKLQAGMWKYQTAF